MLVRPVRLFSGEDMSNEFIFSEKYASVKQAYIISEKDNMVEKFDAWAFLRKKEPSTYTVPIGHILRRKTKKQWIKPRN